MDVHTSGNPGLPFTVMKYTLVIANWNKGTLWKTQTVRTVETKKSITMLPVERCKRPRSERALDWSQKLSKNRAEN